MKQSNNKKSRDVTAFLYERLSRDDNLEGESYSIGNQKKLLAKVAKEKGYTNLVHFLDDGISGVTMDRPGFVEMICQLEQGKAAAVFVKDLSRLGRNYIEVGRLTEEFFPNHDIRLVAVSDNIDTAEGENKLAPIRNLFNEWYARDISKKRRISNKIKGNAGEPMGQPPYGYIKDPNDPKHWIVDDEAAQVVRRVYSMTLEGFGTEQIVTQLEKDGVLTPRAYRLTKGIKRPGKGKQQPPTKWNSSTITKNAAPTAENTICFPACWSAPIAAATFTFTSIRAIRRSSISTAPTTRAIAALAPLPIMPVWTSWRKWYWERYGA